MTTPSAAAIFERLAYGSLRVGDVFVRFGATTAYTIHVTSVSEPARDKGEVEERVSVVGTDLMTGLEVRSRFKQSTPVMAVRAHRAEVGS